jgi:hypothetical protein
LISINPMRGRTDCATRSQSTATCREKPKTATGRSLPSAGRYAGGLIRTKAFAGLDAIDVPGNRPEGEAPRMRGYRNEQTRLFGVVGLVGALFFLVSIGSLQAMRKDLDWTTHYVSDFVNGPIGWLFVVATLVHGLGNLGLGLGLARSLRAFRSSLASRFIVASAIGILVAAIFPTDSANEIQTWTGFVHTSAVSASFALELAAVLILATTISQVGGWKAYAPMSLALSVFAVGGLGAFVILRFAGQLPGLGERVALAAFTAWEVWASLRLIQLQHREEQRL